MNSSSKQDPEGRFTAILASVQSEPSADLGDIKEPKAFSELMAAVALPVTEANLQTSSASVRWEEALSWLDSETLPQADERFASLPDTMAEIAIELSLDQVRTKKELSEVRRRFMRRNHPDRYSGAQRDIATRRASLANTLIDDAEAQIDNHVPSSSSDEPFGRQP